MLFPYTAAHLSRVSLGILAMDSGQLPLFLVGEYIARTTCTECHGGDLNGIPFGPPGKEVPSPNLTPGGESAYWSELERLIYTLA